MGFEPIEIRAALDISKNDKVCCFTPFCIFKSVVGILMNCLLA